MITTLVLSSFLCAAPNAEIDEFLKNDAFKPIHAKTAKFDVAFRNALPKDILTGLSGLSGLSFKYPAKLDEKKHTIPKHKATASQWLRETLELLLAQGAHPRLDGKDLVVFEMDEGGRRVCVGKGCRED